MAWMAGTAPWVELQEILYFLTATAWPLPKAGLVGEEGGGEGEIRYFLRKGSTQGEQPSGRHTGVWEVGKTC